MINDITSLMSLGAATTGAGGAKMPGELGKEDFLRLLVAQLEHQDPLAPTEGTEFTAQLAQFSSLEELMSIGKGIANLTMYQESLNNASSVSLIGKEIKALGDTIEVSGGSISGAYFDLTGDAQSVTVNIYDSEHNLVRTIELGALEAGEHEMEWDGLNSDGSPVEDGVYTIEVEANDANENPIDVNYMISGLVEGVLFENGITWLLVGERKISLSEIISVKEIETS